MLTESMTSPGTPILFPLVFWLKLATHESCAIDTAYCPAYTICLTPCVASLSCRTSGATSSRQAAELQHKALAGFETQLGAHHPHTLSSVHVLAAIRESQGKLEEARPRSGGREVAFLCGSSKVKAPSFEVNNGG